jgi:hypothetical protein
MSEAPIPGIRVKLIWEHLTIAGVVDAIEGEFAVLRHQLNGREKQIRLDKLLWEHIKKEEAA